MSFAERTLAQDAATDPLVRYVSTSGSYGSDGTTWRTAKKNLQDAINDLHSYMQRYGIKEGGRIYVAQGEYTPTESTEESGGGVLYTAFKFYAGISVYGGYVGTETGDALNPENRVMKDGATHPWELANETRLSGNHNTEKEVDFTWNETTKRFNTTFPANSYHVVWFATNGFTGDRANALPGIAVVDGFTIEGGNASERELATRNHTSYGGGVYMVGGAVLQNCVVQKNEATLRGGGVYMDGGGEISECHIHTNQVLGIGIIQGYGGGVCVDDKGSVKHSIIQNNVARMGGGLALTEENADTDDEYKDIAAAGCLVANNTSSAEAGGVFVLQGGLLNHMTIVRNDCAGPDVIVDGRRMGRSGGLYMTKSGFVTNSVIWGNRCNANSGIQFSAYTAKTENLQPIVSYTAVGNGDVTDWTGVKKQNVMSLGNESNTGSGKKYPDFLDKSMTSTTGIDKVPYGAGLNDENIDATLDRWHPAGTSPLREAGVQITNYYSYDKNHLTYLTEDMMGKEFMQLTTLGAYTPEVVTYVPAWLPSEEDPAEEILTFFVDPAAKDLDRTKYLNLGLGSSWDVPVAFVNDVAHWYENNLGKTITPIGGQPLEFTATTPIQIFVKEGNIYPIGYSKTANMRSSYIKMMNNFRIYGSVPKSNEETDVTGRDIKNHTTTLTANITNNGYANNACHIIAYSGASNTVLDGFRIAYANAQASTLFDPVNKNGAGIVIDSKVTGVGDVLNNKVRNCIIANNTAVQGAALFIRSDRVGAEVGITFENCLFHNNTSVDGALKSAVHVESTAEGSAVNVTFNHCNFLKNVGYGLYVKGQKATVTLNNCFVWANASEAMNNSALLAEAGNAAKVRAIAVVDGATLSGSNNLLDAGVALNGLSNSHNHNILTYVNNTDAGYTYPISVNPTKNIGHSESGDLTYYGGAVDYTPRNMSPLVNAANVNSKETFDLFGNERHYGGLPDVGALENTALPASGKILYVRDLGNTTDPGGDGLSWATAINGNCTTYTNNHGFVGYDAEVYSENTALTGLQWAVDEAYFRSLKKDESGNIDPKTIEGVWVDQAKNQDVMRGEIVEEDRVQVWVAEGEYLRRDGFFMRDGVDVYGGFPNFGNPGMTERNPKNYVTYIQTNTTEEIEKGTFSWGNQLSMSECLPSCRIQASTKLDDPEYLYVMRIGSVFLAGDMKYTNEVSATGVFAFFEVTGKTNTYKVYSYGAKKWLSYPEADSYSGRKGFVTSVDKQSSAKEFEITYYDSGKYYDFSPYTSTGNVSSIYLNFFEGIDANKGETIGLWTDNAATDAGSAFYIYKIDGPTFDGTYTGGDDSNGSSYELNCQLKNANRTQRVLTQQFPYYHGENNHDCEFGDVAHPLVGFDYETTWNGFTIRYGRTQIEHVKDGGAGVALRANGRIENCVVRDNINKGVRIRGGGIFCNSGVIANCEIVSNVVQATYEGYGGGMYMRAGTSYNSSYLSNEERCTGGNDGAACFFEDGLFYNNTIAGNKGDHALTTIAYFTGSAVEIYNCIICNDELTSSEVYLKGKDDFNIQMSHCLFKTGKNYSTTPGGYIKINNIYYGDPMFKDEANGDFSLRNGSMAINKGTDVLLSHNNNNINEYNRPLALPEFDAIYAPRIQDCTVDIGAYEYNGAYDITPTTINVTEFDIPVNNDDGNPVAPESSLTQKLNARGTISALTEDYAHNVATYFVTMTGAGVASGENPSNAACRQKLQKVLDAAGRYKYLHPDEQVIVKLATMGTQGYAPSRSTVNDVADLDQSNPRTYSLMVPRGVEVWGGYNDDFKEDERDVINNTTKLTGGYTSDGLNVNCYHVVTFTDDLFDAEGRLITDGNIPTGDDWEGIKATPSLADKAGFMSNYNRAVLDGLFIEEGDASGEDRAGEVGKEYRYGGAAIVTNFAHVRNCVLMNNNAAIGGGALYLEEGALVSGCVLEANTAEHGGAIYVKETVDEGVSPQNETDDYKNNFAHLYSCTIVRNEATDAGGGVWFSNNLRAVNTVVWQNSGSDGTNVSGLTDPFATTEASLNAWDYPFAYSAVENVLMPGVNNISVHTDENKGVHFANTPADMYYPLQRNSVLTRAGYAAPLYMNRVALFPTLETVDMAGNSRLTYNRNEQGNAIDAVEKDYMEIGARAYNGPLEVIPDANNLMKRIYVVKTEDVDHAVYNKISKAKTSDGQPAYLEGSSFAFPMQRLDDALQYVRKARDLRDEDGNPLKNNETFEIFVSRGTYTPVRNVEGYTGALRNNTFLVPEGVSIYGGFVPKNADNKYYGPLDDNSTVDGITLDGSKTKDMVAARERTDLNQNSVLEPWEMKNQTILSGKCVNSETVENVFHVVTAMADPNLVGILPTKRLPIVLSGLQITGGNALHGDADNMTNVQSFYKGGGVMVDGTWGASQGNERCIILVAHECDFSNNRAGDGGAIYSNGVVEVYASSFTQNAAKFCTHSAEAGEHAEHGHGHGGAIFSDYSLTVVNSIFENNEAGAIEDVEDVTSTTELSKGGAIYHQGDQGLVMLNCNVVRNQAVSYPALYVETPNAGGDDPKVNPHKIINSVLWGNELRQVNETLTETPHDFVVNYRQVGKEEQVSSASQFAPWIVEGTPSVAEMLWNCAYESGRGCPATSEPEFRGAAYVYTSSIASNFAKLYDDKRKWANNNIIVHADNEAVDGPNFVSPALSAGVANYMPSADWTISRRNSLVDNGWTMVKLGEAGFSDKNATGATGVYAEVRELRLPTNTYSFSPYPLFDEVYMTYDKNDNNTMYRVAFDPNASTSETYIDIGAYEFYHKKLNPESSETKDILWVAEDSKGEADGSSWEDATSDLQRAIETLLSSRNNHDKEIRLIKGTYAPMYIIDGRQSFTINTSAHNNSATFPDGATNPDMMGVNSLSLIGGWADTYATTSADAQTFPTVLRMQPYEGKDASIFHILDAHNWYYEKEHALPYIKGQDDQKQRVVPITFDGLTFINPYGSEENVGAAIQYDVQKQFQIGQDGKVQVDKNGQFVVTSDLVQSTLGDNVPKLTVTRSKFVLNGDKEAKDSNGNSIKVPAVKIGAGGGYALIYNSVFHSNNGDALVAENTRVLNSTFALNGGGVTLSSAQTTLASGVDLYSRIHNSLFWRNTGTFTVGAGDDGVNRFTNNSYVVNPDRPLSPQETAGFNEKLSDINADVINGPNFKAPNIDATSEAEILARDFSLMPSAKTIGKGSNSLYLKWVHNINTEINTKATIPDTEQDAAYDKRLYGTHIDRGAYEYQNDLQRYIYVDMTHTNGGAGQSWESPYTNLQNAVDLVAVYANVNKAPGYVFCKAGQSDASLTMRENVRVYGSVAANYSALADAEKLDDYVTELLGNRYGVVSPAGAPTVIRGIQTTGDYAQPALLDGFVVTPMDGADVTAPVVDLKGKGAVVRNVAVYGVNNTRKTAEGAGDKSAVRNVGGLLYNVLVRNCSQPAAYIHGNIYGNGRALHCTFVGDVVVDDGGGKVYNSIIQGRVTASSDSLINCHTAGTEIGMFADYLNNHENQNLWYQLEEKSADIDVCGNSLTEACVTDLKTVLGNVTDLKPYVKVDTDRDLLGNPRLLCGALDRGCYETWNVKSGVALEATYNTAGMRFPQDGSVVYVHENGTLVMNHADFALSGSGKGSRLVVQPGYLLLKNGASFYVQGAAVRLNHVGVERNIANYGALVALPYDFNYADVRKVDYENNQVKLTEVASPTWQYYNGAARAEYNYTAVDDNSTCWKNVADEEVMPKNSGRYFKPTEEGVYRFTTSRNDEMVYTEGFAGAALETQKTVMLTQYDKRDNAPNFTTAENMGWNLVGAPYLVANYKGNVKKGGNEYSPSDYNMSLPRMIYTLTADTQNAGAFNSESSVSADGMSPGAAFFTQTAVNSGETEQLVFQLPMYSGSKPAVAAVRKQTLVLTDEAGHADEVELIPATDGTAGSMVYTYGRDAVKWMAMNDALPQAYVLNDSVAGTRFSILGEAPVATEILLGVKAGANGRLTFALSSAEAYETFTNVWLADRETGAVTDLKQNSYSVNVDEGTETASRFTIKFGGNRPEMKDDLTAKRYEVSGKNGVLHINGLMGGETITVYDASGRLMHKAMTSQQRHSVALSTGVYVVRIDNEVHKVTVE